MNESSTPHRCFKSAVIALSLWILVGSPAWAADASAPPAPPSLTAAERAQHRAAFQAYTDAWGMQADGARLQSLRDNLAADMTYQDAAVHAEGASGVDAMIERFQRRSPGVTLRLDDLLVWADHGLAKWSMMDPRGGLIMHGYDVVTYDRAGRIQSIVGFFDTPGQRESASH